MYRSYNYAHTHTHTPCPTVSFSFRLLEGMTKLFDMFSMLDIFTLVNMSVSTLVIFLRDSRKECKDLFKKSLKPTS